MQSNEPTKETQGHIEVSEGNYNTQSFGFAMGGTLLEDVLLGRISLYKNKSDGYMDNSFLNRKDTNNIDELSLKTQLRWLVSETRTIDVNLMHVDVQNGYDAFTLDNSRDSHSDNVGVDEVKTDAIALKMTTQINESMHP